MPTRAAFFTTKQRALLQAEASICETSIRKREAGGWLQPALEERLADAAERLGITLPPHATEERGGPQGPS